ncbi:MAG: type II secretion system protein [Burkholderiaceae bacterium]
MLRRPLRGYSLVEMGVALAILGLLVSAAVAYWAYSTRHTVAQAARDASLEARAALMAFVQARYRLPCPDADGDGVEDGTGGVCPAGTQVGGFPWKTVGVFSPAVRSMRYGVYRLADEGDHRLDVDLTRDMDRFAPLVAQGAPLAADEILLGRNNLMDFCRALDLASRPGRAVDAAHLNIWRTGEPASRRHVAYVLASGGLLDADGDGQRLDGANTSASNANPAFELPTRAASEVYDDTVVAGTFEDLMSELGCPQGLSAIGHTHANAALSAAMMRQGINDYRRQLKLLADAAGAGVAAGTAKVLMTGAALSKAVATMLDQTAVALTSQGALSAILASGTLAIIANTASTVTAAGVLATAIAFKVEADERYHNVAPLVTLGNSLDTSVGDNFRQADLDGF